MDTFERHIANCVIDIISSWTLTNIDDIYVIGIGIQFTDDDTRLGQIVLMHNTEQNCKNQLHLASSPDEAKWNYSFWIHDENRVCRYSKMTLNSHCNQLRLQWLHFLDLIPAGDNLNDLDDTTRYDEVRAFDSFLELCSRLVSYLHESGIILRLLGKTIPIVISILNDMSESEGKVGDRVITSNPSEVNSEIVKWIENRL